MKSQQPVSVFDKTCLEDRIKLAEKKKQNRVPFFEHISKQKSVVYSGV